MYDLTELKRENTYICIYLKLPLTNLHYKLYYKRITDVVAKY